MDSKIMLFFLTVILPYCSAVNVYILTSPEESNNVVPSRRFYAFHPGRTGASRILGAPTSPSHLPEAEPILPGHTLLRPGFSMLKSSVKFPHKDLEDGAGVYGNINNLGITYDGTNERVLYSGFRRSNQPGYTNVFPKKPRVIVFLSSKKQKTNKNTYDKWAPKKIKQDNRYIEKILPQLVENQEFYDATKQGHNDYRLWNNRLRSIDLRNHSTFSNRRANATEFVELPLPLDEVEISSEVDLSTENNGDNVQVHSKFDWFWGMKDAYDHIKVSHEAPTLNELRPWTPRPIVKNWWTFSEYDLYDKTIV